jgi:hypothetical protein
MMRNATSTPAAWHVTVCFQELRMKNRSTHLSHPLFVLSLVLTSIGASHAASGQDPWDWWPNPEEKTGLSVWVSYSRNYADYQRPDFVDQQVNEMRRQGLDVVFVSISNAHLERLGDRNDPFTQDVQYFLNRLQAQGILASAAILSDDFTGSESQMGRYTLVDDIVNFNQTRNLGDAGFLSVATDLEMTVVDGVDYRRSETYALWKRFQLSVKNRIAEDGSSMRLVVWMQSPDSLVDRATDRADFMMSESITLIGSDSRGGLYSGAITYFVEQDDLPIADAVLPMWYLHLFDEYTHRLDHTVSELQNLAGAPYLIAGEKVTDGMCTGDCIRTREEYVQVLDYNDATRLQSSSFLGTALFKWPMPADWAPESRIVYP